MEELTSELKRLLSTWLLGFYGLDLVIHGFEFSLCVSHHTVASRIPKETQKCWGGAATLRGTLPSSPNSDFNQRSSLCIFFSTLGSHVGLCLKKPRVFLLENSCRHEEESQGLLWLLARPLPPVPYAPIFPVMPQCPTLRLSS